MTSDGGQRVEFEEKVIAIFDICRAPTMHLALSSSLNRKLESISILNFPRIPVEVVIFLWSVWV